MKKLRYLLIVHLLIVFNLQGHAQFISQQVIASTGGSGQNGEVQLSWTSGEPFIATFETDDFVLTQGFHQPPHIPSAILPGDANCDGEVNVLDVITAINFILETDPEPFCYEEANVNGDENIDILDAIGIINLILETGKSSLQSSPASIYLAPELIMFHSDGTVSALYFELEGDHLHEVKLKLQIPDHQLAFNVLDNKLIVIIFSIENKPIPAGMHELIHISGGDKLYWGEVYGGNINPQYVPINKHLNIGERASQLSFVAYPNPAKSTLTLQIALPVASNIEFSLNDMLGRQNTYMMETFLEAGQHSIPFNITGLSPGVYALKTMIKPLDKAFEPRQYHQKIIISR